MSVSLVIQSPGNLIASDTDDVPWSIPGPSWAFGFLATAAFTGSGPLSTGRRDMR